MAIKTQASYTIIQTLGELDSTASGKKLLTLTAWNGNPAKLDIRQWYTDKDGTEMPGKGITLTDEEAQALTDALTAYLQNGSGSISGSISGADQRAEGVDPFA